MSCRREGLLSLLLQYSRSFEHALAGMPKSTIATVEVKISFALIFTLGAKRK